MIPFTIQSSVISNANLNGDGGADTFRRSAATINRLNLYSIEARQLSVLAISRDIKKCVNTLS